MTIPAVLNVNLFETKLAAPPHVHVPVPFITIVVVPVSVKLPTERLPPTLRLNAPFTIALPVVVRFPVTFVLVTMVSVKAPIERLPRVGVNAPAKVVFAATVKVPAQFNALDNVRVETAETVMLFHDSVLVLIVHEAGIVRVEPVAVTLPAV